MRLVTYVDDKDIQLGIQINEWILDLQRANDYLSRSDHVRVGRSQSNVLTPELITRLMSDSPFMRETRRTIADIQGSLPSAIEALQSNAILMRFDQVSLKPPLTNPGKIICVGMNYPVLGSAVDQRPAYPVLFLKPNSTLTGHQQPVTLPRISEEVFCEGELAVVIGRAGKHIPAEAALSYVAGYTIANDVGARDLEQRTSQWTTGKLSDSFCPMGPALVTSDEIPKPDELTIKTYINGNPVQIGNTGQMIFSVPYLISYISSITSLSPGDIILTGSPKSINGEPAPTVYLSAGDNISIEIKGIGVLSNHAVAEE
jgi:acylpyruvate hydrolase